VSDDEEKSSIKLKRALVGILSLLALLNTGALIKLYGSGSSLTETAFKNGLVAFYDAKTGTIESITATVEPATPAQPEAEKEATIPATPAKARIAVIIEGVGLSKSALDQALAMPNVFTISISAYSPFISAITNLEKRAERDIFLEVPIASTGGDNGGNLTISADQDGATNNANLQEAFVRLPYATGVYFPSDDGFSGSGASAESIFTTISEKNLPAIIGTPKSVQDMTTIAAGRTPPITQAFVVADSIITGSEILNRLKTAEEEAIKTGYSIVVVRAYDISFKVLQEWYKTLDAEKLEVVKASEITGNNAHAAAPTVTENTTPENTAPSPEQPKESHEH